MARLFLALLGPPQITLDGEPLAVLRSSKERALLAYLALEADRPQSRESLVGLLWADQPQASALHSLRQALLRLRQALGDQRPPAAAWAAPPFLLVTPKTVQFNPAADYSLDVIAFANLVSASRAHRHRNALTCQTCQGWLEQAAGLYRGDLLQGFFLPSSIAFEEWVLVKREQLRRQALEALERLTQMCERRADYSPAKQFAFRQIELEPWRESAHRQLMRIRARGGERAAALAQYEVCRQALKAELGVEPEADTTALYEQIRAGTLPATAGEPLPTPAPGVRPPGRLPVPATPFIGRSAELARLRERLLNPDYRLITVTGEGGVGKTRLALAAGAGVQVDFEHGATFVPLAGLSNYNDLAAAIAAALSFTLYGQDEPQTQLLNYLREKELLLVLDSFEHLLPAADYALGISQAAPRVSLLVTSREPLNFLSEYVVRLEGLPVPPSESDPQAMAYDSVRLFAERAERLAGKLDFDSPSLAFVIQVCRFVEGLPLGIELAAAWVRQLPPSEIARTIRRNLDFLATSMRDLPARHRSLRAVFEGSWQMLTAAEQAALAQASVFRGGFDEAAAISVAEVRRADLDALMNKSLLRRRASGRYDLHELLRQFAAEKLLSAELSAFSSLPSSLVDRHGRFYLGFVAEREAAMKGREPQAPLSEIHQEIDNIRQAWRWAASEAQAEVLARVAGGLATFYYRTGLLQEGQEAFGLALDRLAALVGSALAPGPAQQVQAALSRLSVERAGLLVNLARYEEADALAQEAIALAREAGVLADEATALFHWGVSLTYEGDYAAGQVQFQKALASALSAHLPGVEADCLRNLGLIEMEHGDHSRAQVYLEQSLQLCREMGDRRGEGAILVNLGLSHLRQSDFAGARNSFEQSLDSFRETGFRWAEGLALENLGDCALQQGDYARAQSYLEQALRLQREVGFRWGETVTLPELGNVALQQGDFAGARAYFEQALSLSRELRVPQQEAVALASLSLLYHLEGDDEAAREAARQAALVAQEVGTPRDQAYAFNNLGHALAGLQRLPEAAEAYERALSLRRIAGEHNLAMESLAGLTRVALAQADPAGALTYVEDILRHLETGSLDGTDEPFRIYLTCYRVLRSRHDQRAESILKAAHDRLQARGGTIADPTQRRSFLENVPAHRELVQEVARVAAIRKPSESKHRLTSAVSPGGEGGI